MQPVRKLFCYNPFYIWKCFYVSENNNWDEEKNKLSPLSLLAYWAAGTAGRSCLRLLLLEQRRMSTSPDNVNTQGHHYNMGLILGTNKLITRDFDNPRIPGFKISIKRLQAPLGHLLLSLAVFFLFFLIPMVVRTTNG